ncbi:hypothetical protein, partial [Aetokthonos hydrillicola]|uniref:hypothetical protein n=1 Tax=Aetokthonos hydrillicola TaxID=1550245 RepID=UPI0030DB51B0
GHTQTGQPIVTWKVFAGVRLVHRAECEQGDEERRQGGGVMARHNGLRCLQIGCEENGRCSRNYANGCNREY